MWPLFAALWSSLDSIRPVVSVPPPRSISWRAANFATAKTLHVIIGGFADDGREVVVCIGEEHGYFLGQRHGLHGSEGA